MKNLIIILSFFLSFQLNAQQKKVKSTTKTSSLSYMKNYNGKYPYEVKLIEKKSVLSTRLQKLLGKEKFDFLESHFDVQSPMVIRNNVLIAHGCMQHNCDGIFFNIFYDFKKDIINVRIKNEEKEIEILAEKETFLTEAVSWKTDPLLDF